MKIKSLIVFASVFWCMVTISHGFTKITLAWDKNQDGLTVGYRLYHGYSSREYNSAIDVGDVVTQLFYVLEDRKTNYFAITAYDKNGSESDLSNEAIFKPKKPLIEDVVRSVNSFPVPAKHSETTLSANDLALDIYADRGEKRVVISGRVGDNFVIEYTIDFSKWESIHEGTIPPSGRYQWIPPTEYDSVFFKARLENTQ